MSTPTPETPPPGPPPEPMSAKDERMWAMLAHLSGILLALIGPLAIWLIKKEESPFVDEHGREALNFQISILIYMLICLVIAVPLMFSFVIGVPLFMCIGFVLPPALYVYDIVMCILAGLKANQGKSYRYPLTIRLIS